MERPLNELGSFNPARWAEAEVSKQQKKHTRPQNRRDGVTTMVQRRAIKTPLAVSHSLFRPSKQPRHESRLRLQSERMLVSWSGGAERNQERLSPVHVNSPLPPFPL